MPLPTLDERIDILKVHFRDKKIAEDVSIEVVARGTPGMSGADLANLVNESALFAVRRGENAVHKEDFEDARDRVLMGLKRPTVVMNDEEKEHTAYHEAGHAIAAYVSEHADPVHKVTILPTGMALGMTQQLPEEERYSHDKDVPRGHARRAARRPGGRGHRLRLAVDRREQRPRARHRDRAPHGAGVGHVGAHRSDGLGLAGRGVPRRGPRAHPRLLRRDRPRHRRGGRADPARRPRRAPATLLTKYRDGLDAVAQALLQHETLDGLEVERLVDGAAGHRVGGPRMVTHADGHEEAVDEEGSRSRRSRTDGRRSARRSVGCRTGSLRRGCSARSTRSASDRPIRRARRGRG